MLIGRVNAIQGQKTHTDTHTHTLTFTGSHSKLLMRYRASLCYFDVSNKSQRRFMTIESARKIGIVTFVLSPELLDYMS